MLNEEVLLTTRVDNQTIVGNGIKIANEKDLVVYA